MMSRVYQQIFQFLKSRVREGDSLLLGLSGGADSMALFCLLQRCRKQLPFRLGIAHLDHGWRVDSTEEAHTLRQFAAAHKVPFHLRTAAAPPSGNLEEWGRQRRRDFFTEICRKNGYRAVLLGHHLDDQAETVLKNLLEGAGLTSCNGIADVTEVDGLEIWRPLLRTSRNELRQLLEDEQESFFTDPTNFDTRFLRARMRLEVLPHLESLFGKGVRRSLVAVGRESEELEEFLASHLAGVLQRVQKSIFGAYLDLGAFPDLSRLELKYILRRLCRAEGCVLSRDILEQAAVHLECGAADKQYLMGGAVVHVDRKRLFVADASVFSPEVRKWSLEVKGLDEPSIEPASCWKELLNSQGEVVLPKSEAPYRLDFTLMSEPYPGSSSTIGDWWSKHKVPAFLRRAVPVLWCGDAIAHEFLTGRKKPLLVKNDCLQKVSLIRKG